MSESKSRSPWRWIIYGAIAVLILTYFLVLRPREKERSQEFEQMQKELFQSPGADSTAQ